MLTCGLLCVSDRKRPCVGQSPYAVSQPLVAALYYSQEGSACMLPLSACVSTKQETKGMHSAFANWISKLPALGLQVQC
jgi:hypothetical protein